MEKAVEMLIVEQPGFIKPDKIADYKIIAGGRLLHFLKIVVDKRKANEKKTSKCLKGKKGGKG